MICGKDELPVYTRYTSDLHNGKQTMQFNHVVVLVFNLANTNFSQLKLDATTVSTA